MRIYPSLANNLSIYGHGWICEQLFGSLGPFNLPSRVVLLDINSDWDHILKWMPDCNAYGVEADWQLPELDSKIECDVGWNPRWPIFHERSGSRNEHEEHEEKTRENHSNQQDLVTHMLDPRNTKRYTIRIQQRTIHRVASSSPKEVLMIFPKEVLNPRRIFSEEVWIPRDGVDPDG